MFVELFQNIKYQWKHTKVFKQSKRNQERIGEDGCRRITNLKDQFGLSSFIKIAKQKLFTIMKQWKKQYVLDGLTALPINGMMKASINSLRSENPKVTGAKQTGKERSE